MSVRIPANGHVCFTPESGHVLCGSACPLWTNSGHSINLETRSPAVRKAEFHAAAPETNDAIGIIAGVLYLVQAAPRQRPQTV